jgi:hypothetical protein
MQNEKSTENTSELIPQDFVKLPGTLPNFRASVKPNNKQLVASYYVPNNSDPSIISLRKDLAAIGINTSDLTAEQVWYHHREIIRQHAGNKEKEFDAHNQRKGQMVLTSNPPNVLRKV